MVKHRGNLVVETALVFLINASVVVKCYISEEDRERALKVRRDYLEGGLTSRRQPFIYEVFNALRYRPGLSPSDIARYVDSILDMQMDLRLPSEEANRIAAKLAVKEGISGYDAHYIAMAQSMRARLLTSDAKLRDKLSEETRKSVNLLREYN